MANRPSADRTAMRRRDRAQDDAWIRRMLHGAATGVLATQDGGQPFLMTNLYLYDEDAHAVYVHGAGQGRTRSNVMADGRVCFTVMELGRMLPADEALEFSCEFASVVVFGTATLVEDEAEARTALQRLLDKYFADLEPGRDYRPITDDEMARTAVFRIAIEEWSGKRKQAPEDFPNARVYSAPSMLQPVPAA